MGHWKYLGDIFHANIFKNVVLILICVAKLPIRNLKKSDMLIRDLLIKKCVNVIKSFD